MVKIFKFSLLLTLSLNLFANSITTDFMQKDFKITYEWLAEKPKSSAKDFFILQYLENEDLSYEFENLFMIGNLPWIERFLDVGFKLPSFQWRFRQINEITIKTINSWMVKKPCSRH